MKVFIVFRNKIVYGVHMSADSANEQAVAASALVLFEDSVFHIEEHMVGCEIITNYQLSKRLHQKLHTLACAERKLSPFDDSFLKDAKVITDEIASTWDAIENIPWTEDEINAQEARYDR